MSLSTIQQAQASFEPELAVAQFSPENVTAETVEGSALSRRAQRAVILVAAAVLRVSVGGYALAHFGTHWFFTRGMEMGLLADSLAHGQGLGSPFGIYTGPTAIVAPGYPLFVAAVFRFLGSYSLASALTLVGFNVLLNTVTVWLIMRMTRKLAGERPALIAGAFWACSLPLLWLPTVFWETSLSSCLLLVAIALCADLCNSGTAWKWLAYGALCGVAGLINPALLPSLVLVAGWAAFSQRSAGWRGPFVAGLMFLAIYSPWPIRNYRVFHAWIPTRTTVGLELWMGNQANSEGYLQEALFPTFNKDEMSQYIVNGEVKYTQGKMRLANAYIRQHPGRFVHLTVLRIARFWFGTGTRNGSKVFALHAVATTLLGAIGLGLLFLRKRHDILPQYLLPLGVFPLPYFVTHAEFRYRIVVDPILVVLAGVAIERAMLFLNSSSTSLEDLPAPVQADPF